VSVNSFLSVTRVHLIGDTADHLVDSFLFNGDARVDEVFKSGRVRGDSVEVHGDRFGSGYLLAVFDKGVVKMNVSFVLILDCKVDLPGSDEECFDQLSEAVLEATDAGNGLRRV
jgi:hypothetical protein